MHPISRISPVRSVACKSTASQRQPPSCAIVHSKRDFLSNRIRVVRDLIEREDDEIEKEALYSELYKNVCELAEVNIDPLTNEICTKEPWLDECKVYDV